MKMPAVLALASLALASACASVSPSQTAAASAPAAGKQYCWKHRLVVNEGAFACNWAPSVAEACRFDETVYIAQKAVEAEPRDAGRCANGQWLVSVTTR